MKIEAKGRRRHFPAHVRKYFWRGTRPGALTSVLPSMQTEAVSPGAEGSGVTRSHAGSPGGVLGGAPRCSRGTRGRHTGPQHGSTEQLSFPKPCSVKSAEIRLSSLQQHRTSSKAPRPFASRARPTLLPLTAALASHCG